MTFDAENLNKTLTNKILQHIKENNDALGRGPGVWRKREGEGGLFTVYHIIHLEFLTILKF